MTSTTADDILDLKGRAYRSDRFTFELVDINLNHLGDLSVGRAPTIQMSTSQTVFWSMSNFSLYKVSAADIDVFKDRVRVTVLLNDGTIFPLGVFAFGTVPKARKSFGDVWTPSMFDESWFLDQSIDSPISIAAGGSILQAFETVAASYGITTLDLSRVVDQRATEPLLWVPGTSGYTALKGMATVLGCFPPFFDAAHVLTLKAPPFPGDVTVDHVYDRGTHIVRNSSVLTSDLYQLPNRWILYATSASTSIVGVYDLPPSAPASKENRGGKIVSKTVPQPGLPVPQPGESLQEAANAAARTAALQDSTVYEKATWNTTVDPRHGIFDTVSLYGDRYLETGWTIECKSGGAMTHSAIRLYD